MLMEQQSLFDAPLANHLKENGIKQVELNANQQWLQEAFKVVEMLSLKALPFTSDDVWEWMQELHPALETHNHSAMGAVFRKASQHKICIPTGQYVQSKRPSAQSREIKVWRGRR
jgi:hypothetical protein